MKRIHVAQSADLAAEVYDEDYENFRLVISHRSSRKIEEGADLPPDAAPFDGKIYRSKKAAIHRANALTGNAATHGGPGRGQGLKAADGATGLKRTNISIDPASADYYRTVWGGGDLSLGLRLCATAHLKSSA